MRKSTFLALAVVAAIVIPQMAYGQRENAPSAAAPMAAPVDRAALTAQILSTWRGEISARGMDVAAWESDLRQALATRNDGQLLSLEKASSYDALIRQLGGLAAPGMTSASPAGVKFSSASPTQPGPSVLGDFSADLTFVPITPCRAFDTRFGSGAGKIAAGGTKAFYTNEVSAGAVTWAAQGGDSSNCPQIPFDPRAVMITLTAVNEEATGYLTAWPYGDPYPPTSHLNWTINTAIPNNAIANTTAVLTCYSCGPDINIAVSAKTNVIGDVVGYFEPAYPGTVNGFVLGAAHVNGTAVTVSRSFTSVGSAVTVSQPTNPGRWIVDFGGAISSRFYSVIPGEASSGVPNPGYCSATPASGVPNGVFVKCWDSAGNPVNIDFYVVVY